MTRRLGLQRVAIVVVCSLASACGGLEGDFCDEKLECERLSDKEYDICMAEQEAAADIADTYGCSAQHEAFQECYLDKYRCRDGEMRLENDACKDLQEERDRCIADGSSLN